MKFHDLLFLPVIFSFGFNTGSAALRASVRLVEEGKLTSAGENAYVVKKLNWGNEAGGEIPKGLTVLSIPQGEGKFVQYGGEPIRDAGDLSARFAAGYDEKGLWIFIDVQDDQIRTVKGASMFEGDSVQIAIDQSGRRMDGYDENNLEFGFALEGKSKQSWCWTLGRALTRKECLYDVHRTEKGYFLSAHLLWPFLNKIDRVQKRIFAFNFIVNDNDGTSRKGWAEFRPGIGTVKSHRDSVVMVLESDRPLVTLLTKKTYVDRITGKALVFFAEPLKGKLLSLTAVDKAGQTIELIKPIPINQPPGVAGIYDFNVATEKPAWGKIQIRCLVDGQVYQETEAENMPLQATIESYKKTAGRLEEQIAKLKAARKPVRYLLGLLAVIQSQTQFAEENIKDPDFTKTDLYLNKAIRRLREMDEVVKLLETRIREVAEGKKNERFKTFTYVTSPIELKEGFYQARTVDDEGRTAVRPVIFNGYLTLVECGTRLEPKKLNELYGLFEAMGNNCIQYAGFGPYIWSYDGKHKIMNQNEKGEFVYDPAVVAGERVSASLEFACKNNLAIDIHLNIENIYPREITDLYHFPFMNSGFLRYQFDDPRARKFIELYLKSVIKDLKNHPYRGSIASFCLLNEPIYIDMDITSDFQKEHFLTFLKNRYQNNIRDLNRTYKTQFSDFGQVIRSLPNRQVGYENAFTDKDNRVLAYDWHSYKRKKFADWVGWMSDIVHTSWPGSKTQTKIMVYKSFLAGEAYNNVDPELFAQGLDLNGNDNYFMYPGCAVFLSPGYACDWLSTAMNYDLQTSLKKVITCNTETHIIEDHDQRDISYDHVYTALFQQFMHGMGFSATWAWNDQREGGYWGLYGLFPERPIAAAASGQVTLDANRLAYEIKAFFDEKPKIAIIYSPTSYLYNPNYSTSATAVYKALNFLGYKIGFISERQIQAGQFGDLALIIAPDVSHVLPGTIEKLKPWINADHEIISLGPSFNRDQFDNEIRPELKTFVLDRNIGPEWLAKILKSRIEKRIGKTPVEVVGLDGEIPDGVEWRIVRDRTGYLLNVVNYNATLRTIRFINNRKGTSAFTDLISGENVGETNTIKPLVPMLIRVSDLRS
jgi:hypothetical protein